MQVDDEPLEIPTDDLTLEQIDRASVYDLREIANYLQPNGGGWGFFFGGNSRIVVQHENMSPVSVEAEGVRFLRLGDEIFVARA